MHVGRVHSCAYMTPESCVYAKNLKVNLLEEEYINEIVEEILSRVLGISKYYILSSNAKFRSLTRKLKKVILESIVRIWDNLKEL